MKSSQLAKDRAMMPAGANQILDERTIEHDNRNLLNLLTKNLRVLDAGCGSGAITHDIARRIAPGGHATGIDISEELIAEANARYIGIKNLLFHRIDIYNYSPAEKFHLITSARVLQWIADPAAVLNRMKNFLTPDGRISILDYNHEKIMWAPRIPESMFRFYQAFLQWRKDAGFDNAIADHLEQMFKEIGFNRIVMEKQFEETRKTDENFSRKARIWSIVAETRGKQLVKDNYITDLQRLAAIKDYDDWICNHGQSMQMYLLSATAEP